LWQFSYKNHQFELTKRIHIKTELVQAVSDSQLYFILGRPGKVLILDGAGQYVTTMSATGHSNEDFESDEVFTSVELGEGKLLLGTSTG
jgi:hypothetical protein